jgi:hypothetical protein
MKSFRVTTLGTVLLASALPVVGAVLVIVDHPRGVSVPAPELLQSQMHVDVRTLSGKIIHKSGKYIFHEAQQGTVYFLDDQFAAQKFSGRSVLVTGKVDAKRHSMQVHKIEAT